MPRPSTAQPHPIFGDRIRLYEDRKDRGTGVWEAQFRQTLNDKWSQYRVVGKSHTEAVKTSAEILLGGQPLPVVREGKPKPPPSPEHTFADAAELVFKDLDAVIVANRLTDPQEAQNARKYKQIIRDVLLPFFRAYSCDAIDGDVAYKFQVTHRNKNGTKPSASAMGSYSAEFRKVLKRAAEMGWRSRDGIPSFSKAGLNPSVTRPDLSESDIKKLFAFMTDQWCDSARRDTTRADRRLLRAFMAICYLSGARPGTELTEMRWGQIVADEKDFLITFKGKTRRRETPISDADLKPYAKYLEDAAEINGMADGTLVFARKDGKVWHDNFMRLFSQVRDQLHLKPTIGKLPFTLYSFRHFCATRYLRAGLSEYETAQAIGTGTEMIKKHYSHVQPAEITAKIKKVNARQRLKRLQEVLRNEKPEEHPEAVEIPEFIGG